MLKGKVKYRLSLALRAKKLMLRNLQFRKHHKERLICKAKGQPYKGYKKCIRCKTIHKDVPSQFSVFDNQEEIFNFFNDILDMHSNRKLRQINLNLENVHSLDSATVCLLLSVISELNNYGIKVIGNYPNDESCSKIFIESGFLNHVKNSNGHRINLDTPNLLIETGHNMTRNKDIAAAIQQSMKNLTGKERRFQPSYTVAMEICSNSVEHAYANRPIHWKLSAYKCKEKIAFTMTDTGVGILNTLHRKFRSEIYDCLKLRNNCDILYRAFKRKYGSSTQLVNRNKGLPCILDKFKKGYIKNLKVITNDVFLDFNNKINNKILRNQFSGVLFYWEIDNESILKFDNDKNL